jgi:hypothetical protein
MDQRKIVSWSAMTVLGFALLPGSAVAQLSDIDKIKATNDAFHVALDGRVPSRLQAGVRRHRVRSGRSPDWLKSKNPACAAVKRDVGEDWGR